MKTYIDPFKTIRNLSAGIIQDSTDLVVINHEAVNGELKSRLEQYRQQRKGNPLSILSISPQNEIGLILFYNTINFCYRDPHTGHDYEFRSDDGRILKSTSAMLAALLASGIQWNHLEQVSSITSSQWLRMFQLDPPNILYLGMQRRERVTGLAKWLLLRGFDSVMEVVAASHYNVLELADELQSSGFFKDEFLKRLQVALKRIDGILDERLNQHLNGMQLLTCMADYSIPQLFYNLGVLELAPALRRHLEAQKPILTGSREELALRASVVVIAEGLAEQIDVTESELNNFLWELAVSLEAKGKLPIPHMLVATDEY
jgi:hypothetical protein